VMHFGTDKSYGFAPDPVGKSRDGGWLNIIRKVQSKERPFSFVADVRNSFPIRDLKTTHGVGYIFAPGAPTDIWIKLQKSAALLDSDFIWSVSPGYYMQGRKTFLPPDFGRIHEIYVAAMANHAKAINVISWNDFGEDTDIVPSRNKGGVLLHLLGFYNSWFKTGHPQIPVRPMAYVSYPLRAPDHVVSGYPAWDLTHIGENPFVSGVYYWAVSPQAKLLVIGDQKIVVPPNTVVFGHAAIATDRKFKAGWSENAKDMFPTVHVDNESQGRLPGGLEFRYIEFN